MRSIRAAWIALAATAFVNVTVSAQQPMQDPVPTVSERFKTSMAALRQYEWIETTSIAIKGEVKGKKQNRCYYDATGKLTKVPADSGAEEKKKRGLRGKAAAKKKEEIATGMEEAVALVHQYIPPDPAKIQAAKGAGKLALRPADNQGRAGIDIKDYLKPGDLLTIDVDVNTNSILKVTVSSYTTAKDKDAVEVVANFASLPDGTIYAATTTFDLKDAGATVTVENSGYKKI